MAPPGARTALKIIEGVDHLHGTDTTVLYCMRW
jgi:hypothetical protein